MKIKFILIVFIFITGCDAVNQVPPLTMRGQAGYEFCLKHQTEKLYIDEDVYSCEYYLIRYKKSYERSKNNDNQN